jgi:hypothetical protein
MTREVLRYFPSLVHVVNLGQLNRQVVIDVFFNVLVCVAWTSQQD